MEPQFQMVSPWIHRHSYQYVQYPSFHARSDIPDAEKKRLNGSTVANIRSPAMAGGLFTIDREFFYNVGAYDAQMKIWGSENIEMSIRLWTCGGAIEISPCSHVGHVFRSQSPHSFPGGADTVIARNKARVADVWLDEWSKIFFVTEMSAASHRTDVSERLQLRKNLKCKSFRWFLKNIFPTSPLRAFGDISSITMVWLPIESNNIHHLSTVNFVFICSSRVSVVRAFV